MEKVLRDKKTCAIIQLSLAHSDGFSAHGSELSAACCFRCLRRRAERTDSGLVEQEHEVLFKFCEVLQYLAYAQQQSFSNAQTICLTLNCTSKMVYSDDTVKSGEVF